MALIQGVTNAFGSPAATPEGQPTPNALRMGKFNELYVGSMVPTKHLACLAGYYYSATLGATAVVTTLATLTEASPAMIIENSGLAGGPSIMLDYVRLIATAVDAVSTTWAYSWKTDTIRGKWGSGGSALTPLNCNMGATNASVATIHFGALLVATAQQSSNNARVFAAGNLAPTGTAPVTLIGDVVDFRFGCLEGPLPTTISNVASNGIHTFAMGYPVSNGPLVIPPGTTATLFLFNAGAMNAPSYAVNMGWFEY